MIITVTANPAVDIVYVLGRELDAFGLNRAKEAVIHGGGKGINVSRAVLREGGEVLTLALIGGHSGRLLSDKLKEEGILLTEISSSAETRVNICTASPEGNACEINAPGGPVTADELEALSETLLSRVSEGDVVILSGSLPPCAGYDSKGYWASLVPKLKGKGCTVILDCSGEALRLAVNGDCPPDLIKPNLEELCELSEIDRNAVSDFCGSESEIRENTFKIAEKASERAAKKGISVLTTLGALGSVYTSGENPTCHVRCDAVKIDEAINIKGAGDTFLGVFAYRYFILGQNLRDSLDSAAKSAADHVAAK